MKTVVSVALASASLVTASPLAFAQRAVTALDQAAFEEAQQPDATATKAFSGIQIQTSDKRCLFVDELSGDFRANLTPIQVGECGSTDGQGWDIITSGKHNNVADSMLIVSTLTNACFNFDPRRAAGNQVLLFSCGGRADGGGEVTDSQLFPYFGGTGPGMFSPENDAQSCLTVDGDVLSVAACATNNNDQMFTFGDDSANVSIPAQPSDPIVSSGSSATTASPVATTTGQTTGSVDTTTTALASDIRATASSTGAAEASSPATSDAPAESIPDPTEAVPVSRAGGTLVPTAAAESHERDNTATRVFTSVSIKAPGGQCLFIDPTAGDFRQNLIPVSLVDCAGAPNEKFDVITAGVHNDAQDSALLVSSLMNGCISFDSRRPAGDTVTIFSCGGRADGGGLTNTGQLIPFTGGTDLVLAPESDRNVTCIVPGTGRLDSAPCSNDGSQVFTILT
ncbi:Uu.00g079290.m01.CDS01 [Anthostomella pinea]|uniref:Uu.00g079290.m01.CDS01 n=1 Tax=Anthostomella pinea TaxID=933095 RepID=A0AAI8VFE1_9PEZI|nr:Uu.00g079290.m01.CDS01 [Anthostomella pinea]